MPPTIKLRLTGTLRPGVVGKDVIVAMCAHFSADQVLNTVLEVDADPDSLASLSVDDRLTIANMSTEWGALGAVFPVDDLTARYLCHHTKADAERVAAALRHPLTADATAHYASTLTVHLDTIRPCVSGPNSVKTYRPVDEVEAERIPVHKAYLLSCVNARASDLRQAAGVVRGHRVAPGVSLYLAAASSHVQEAAEASGDWQALLDAGAIPLVSGCGPCIGLGVGVLLEGETGISATNRNYRGRMGSPKATTYLASPAVVAASALSG